MIADLLTEQRNPASSSIDRLTTEEMLRVINAEDAKVAAAVGEAIPGIATLIDRARNGCRPAAGFFTWAQGPAGASGCSMPRNVPRRSASPPTWCRASSPAARRRSRAPPRLPKTTQRTAARICSPGSSTGATRWWASPPAAVRPMCSARCAPRQLPADSPRASAARRDSELSAAVEIPIELLVGPEVITGSTRLKAGTATKLALNMISTGIMIRLGHVYGNLMVNVQPTNDKLRDRAARVIAAAAGPYRRIRPRICSSKPAASRPRSSWPPKVSTAMQPSDCWRRNGILAKALSEFPD